MVVKNKKYKNYMNILYKENSAKMKNIDIVHKE